MKPLFKRLTEGEVLEDFESHRIELRMGDIPLGRFDVSYDTSQSVLDICRSECNDRVVEGVRIISATPYMAQALEDAKNIIEEMLSDADNDERLNDETIKERGERARRTLTKIVEVERLINTGSSFEKEDGDD